MTVEVERLAADLRAATASLADHIEARAREMAAPRIAAAEEEAAGRVAAIEESWAFERQRWADLEAEFRRQLAVTHRVRDRLMADNARLKHDLEVAEGVGGQLRAAWLEARASARASR